MDFKQTENTFKELKAQFESGKLTEAEFKSQLEELMIQDVDGNWWIIGYETELWYRHDGEKWVQSEPQGRISGVTTHPKWMSIFWITLGWAIGGYLGWIIGIGLTISPEFSGIGQSAEQSVDLPLHSFLGEKKYYLKRKICSGLY